MRVINLRLNFKEQSLSHSLSLSMHISLSLSIHISLSPVGATALPEVFLIGVLRTGREGDSRMASM